MLFNQVWKQREGERRREKLNQNEQSFANEMWKIVCEWPSIEIIITITEHKKINILTSCCWCFVVFVAVCSICLVYCCQSQTELHAAVYFAEVYMAFENLIDEWQTVLVVHTSLYIYTKMFDIHACHTIPDTHSQPLELSLARSDSCTHSLTLVSFTLYRTTTRSLTQHVDNNNKQTSNNNNALVCTHCTRTAHTDTFTCIVHSKWATTIKVHTM